MGEKVLLEFETLCTINSALVWYGIIPNIHCSASGVTKYMDDCIHHKTVQKDALSDAGGMF